MNAEQLLREGKLAECLAELQGRVRAEPANPKLRVFLFQLFCVLGEWDRALTQLNVAAELDHAQLLAAVLCRPALQCEALRTEIFAGNHTPVIFGDPAEWVGLLVQALKTAAQGNLDAWAGLRDRALADAPPSTGTIDGQPFEWIADADSRLGPVLEAIIDGRYYWVPFSAIREIAIEPPSALRDWVWAPASFTWANGGTAAGLIPARYPGSEDAGDPLIRLGRKTEWLSKGGHVCAGIGQRILATDAGEYMLLDVRRIVVKPPKGDAR